MTPPARAAFLFYSTGERRPADFDDGELAKPSTHLLGALHGLFADSQLFIRLVEFGLSWLQAPWRAAGVPYSTAGGTSQLSPNRQPPRSWRFGL